MAYMIYDNLMDGKETSICCLLPILLFVPLPRLASYAQDKGFKPGKQTLRP
jgi:hypothetical protein